MGELKKHLPIEKIDNETRWAAAELLCPDLTGLSPTLYVGASVWRHDFLDQWPGADVVEIVKKNADSLADVPNIGDVYNCGINDFKPEKHYALSVWWMGPEHIPQENVPQALTVLESCCDNVLLSVPWGVTTGDPTHLWAPEIGYFEDLGYDIVTTGIKDQELLDKASAIIAFKKVR